MNCAQCGTPVPAPSPAGSPPVACARCAAPLGRHACPDCAASLFGAERFCPHCGCSLKGVNVLTGTKHLKILERYLPERSLERLLASEAGLVSERKYAAVVFADVTGFASLGEELGAEQVAETMNGVFEGLVAAVHRYDGSVDKFVGDAVMAVFGAPVGHDNDPERAVCAALEMMAFVRAHSDKLGRRLSLSVGINAGPLVAGSVGGHGRFNYTVLGDTVNVAQRLESAAGAGRILVTREVYQRAREVVRFKVLAPVNVKGKRNPVDVWEARERRPRGEAKTLARGFLGRAAELEALRAAMAGTGRAGRAVVVAGEAGVGRTALVKQLLTTFKPGSVQACYASCPAYPSEADAGLLTETVAQLLKVRVGQGAGAVRDGRAKLVELGLSEQEASLLLAGAARDKPDTGVLDYEATLRATCAAFMRVLAAYAARTPLVVAFDDLQWATPSVRALVGGLTELPLPPRVLLVLGTRLGEPLLEKWKGLQRVDLAPLGSEDTRALVTGRLGLAVLDDKVAARIFGFTHGNPRMVEDLLQSLIDGGVIFRSRNRWLVSPRFAEVQPPASIDVLVSARLDELDPDTRRFAQAAAVVGSRFDPEVVRRVAGLQLDLEWVLSNLLDRRMLVADEERTSLMRFAHDTLRRVAADAMGAKERRGLHLRFAQYLMETTDLQDPRALLAVAHHFAEAKDAERGGPVLLKAGKRLMEIHQVDSAIELLEKLLQVGAPRGFSNYELSRCENELDEALYQLGLLYLRKGLLDRAEERLQWAYGRARHFFNGDLRVWSLLGLARLGMARSRPDEARKFLELAAVDSEGMRDPALQALALLERSRLFAAEGRADAALEAADKALEAEAKANAELRATLPQPLTRALILLERGTALAAGGREDEATSALVEALALGGKDKDANAVGRAALALGRLDLARKDMPKAQEHLAEALRAFRVLGDRVSEGRCMHDFALLELARNNRARAADALGQAEGIFTEIANREGLALVAQLRGVLGGPAAQARS